MPIAIPQYLLYRSIVGALLWHSDADSDDARALRPLQAAACTYRIAFGPRAGQKVFTVQGAMPRDAWITPTLCADVQGFSLHAAVRCGRGPTTLHLAAGH